MGFLQQLNLPFFRQESRLASLTQEKSVPKSKLLEAAIRKELGRKTRIVIVDNRCTLLSQSKKNGWTTVRVHQLFLDADVLFFKTLAKYLRTGQKAAGKQIDAYIESRSHLLDHHISALAEDAHLGTHHDLKQIYDQLNQNYFSSAIQAELAWGQTGSFRGRKRRSIILGSYDSRAARITMHPALDQAQVPEICVARVLHHEMLHAVFPERRSASGRRILHGAEFKRAEAFFHEAKEADEWLDTNLDQLLRYRNSGANRVKKVQET
jgi:hypothetical protein